MGAGVSVGAGVAVGSGVAVGTGVSVGVGAGVASTVGAGSGVGVDACVVPPQANKIAADMEIRPTATVRLTAAPFVSWRFNRCVGTAKSVMAQGIIALAFERLCKSGQG